METETKRKLASIQVISKIEPIPGADLIEKATVKGWECVVRKGEFKVGDLCVYFEIDSMIPRRFWSEFLFKDDRQYYRLRTVRLKGQISQGLIIKPNTCIPMEIILKLVESSEDLIEKDVTDYLEITKYEPEIPAQLRGLIKGSFPHFIPKTDEERIQNIPWILEQEADTEIVVTEKLDGTSMTVYVKDGEFGVCSRNIEFKECECIYWQIAKRDKFDEKLKSLNKNIALQGELIGLGIQGNKYKLAQPEFYIFNIFDIEKNKFLDYQEIEKMLEWIQSNNLKFVPKILEFKAIKEIGNLQDFIKLSTGKSLLNPTVEKEGIVVRSKIEKNIHNLGRFSFKVINPEFLLKHGE